MIGSFALSKLKNIANPLRGYESCLVAYSGGVDSVLPHVAYEELGGRMLAVIADSPSLPRLELTAKAVAVEFGFPLEIVGMGEFENPTTTTIRSTAVTSVNMSFSRTWN